MSPLRSNDACWCGSGKKLKRCHGDHAAVRRPPRVQGRVGPARSVPDHIARPPYIITGSAAGPAGVQILAGDELERMRRACRVAAEVLIETGAAVAPGVTTEELDAIAHDAYVARGAYPSTLGYRGYPKSICTSVNEVVCHGIPDDQPLRSGDIVNIDVTAFVDGMHGDTSATFAVGRLDPPTEGLVATTCEATMVGIGAVGPGRTHHDIGRAIEPFASKRGLGVIRDYGGHGIGSVFHAAPHISHVDERSDGAAVVLAPGMTFTVEPMLTAGTHRHTRWSDGWTEVTDDLLPSAQFEHTVTVTDAGVEILTVTADGDTAVTWPNVSREARLAFSQLEAGLAHVASSPRDHGTLRLLVRRPSVDGREVLDRGELDVDAGLVGDSWGTREAPDPERQLTLMNWRAISLISPDEARRPLAGDQLFVDFDLSAANVPAGSQLAIGGAVVEITAPPHRGCRKFSARFGGDALRAVNSPAGIALNLRGVNARVIRSGAVVPGDRVVKLAQRMVLPASTGSATPVT